MAAVNFYADDNNLIDVLAHWLAIFTEGNDSVNVPISRDTPGGPINRVRTLDAPCYRDFPPTEKAKWLRAEDNV